MKSKIQRRTEAQKRQEAYDKLSLEEKVNKAKNAPGFAMKQILKLVDYNNNPDNIPDWVEARRLAYLDSRRFENFERVKGFVNIPNKSVEQHKATAKAILAHNFDIQKWRAREQ